MASPYTEVTSAFDEGDGFDLTVSLDYGFELHSAEIKREFDGLSMTSPDDPLPEVKDLLFEQSRHLIVPRLELGIFTDLSVSVALPLVMADSRTLKLDQRTEPVIDRANSTTIVDGFLPINGFDADDPDTGFATGDTIFRGPGRAGLDQLHLGLTWAAMNQSREPSQPIWKLGAEFRLAIGSPMQLDRLDPDSQTSVGRGLHEIKLWTSLAKRAGWAEPFAEIWWQAPIGTTDDSAFFDLGFGQNRAQAQQRAGTRFGVDATVWERAPDNQRITLGLTG
ncbi:MAG: hypothetical protein AAGC55_27940, partial [Myxococcota bacterium]